MQEFRGLPWLTHQKWCFGGVRDCQGETVTLIRGVEVQEPIYSTIQDRQYAPARLILGVGFPRM
eukprot:1907080-Pyramimonas_sp.AAC.1